MSTADDWDAELYRDGYSQGQRWQSIARPVEVRRLRKLYESLSSSDWHWLFTSPDGPPATNLAATADPNCDGDRAVEQQRWEEMAGSQSDDVWEPEFVMGFAEGALELEPSVEVDVQEDGGAVDSERAARRSTDTKAELPPRSPEEEEYGKEFRGMTLRDTDNSTDESN